MPEMYMYYLQHERPCCISIYNWGCQPLPPPRPYSAWLTIMYTNFFMWKNCKQLTDQKFLLHLYLACVKWISTNWLQVYYILCFTCLRDGIQFKIYIYSELVYIFVYQKFLYIIPIYNLHQQSSKFFWSNAICSRKINTRRRKNDCSLSSWVQPQVIKFMVWNLGKAEFNIQLLVVYAKIQ